MTLLQRGTRALVSLEALFETQRGMALPLTPNLKRLYGSLRMPRPRTRPYRRHRIAKALRQAAPLRIRVSPPPERCTNTSNRTVVSDDDGAGR